MNYDFKILNDKEFEELCRELLQRYFNKKFSSFKRGRDKGIDLRYSTSEEDNQIIVQVKHYSRSKFSDLKRALIHDERKKVEKLNPRRYIIITSLDLSPFEVEEVRKIFPEYVHSLQDIWFNQTINSLLLKYPEVEKIFYKLWLTSTNVLEKVLHNSSYLKADFLKRYIDGKISYYVEANAHQVAYEKLVANKIILITGAPGVGKTTLANLLLFKAISLVGCELIVVDDKIEEAERLISLDSNRKQIVFFDDFLGANIYEVLNPRNSENALVKFIEKIRGLKGKYLVATTRTTILNQTTSRFEKIHHVYTRNRFDYRIKLGQYTLMERAKILYNHLYFNSTDSRFMDEVRKDRFYMKVVEHANYNPRLVEYFTTPAILKDVPVSKYRDFVESVLENPQEVWRHPYENLLSLEDKIILWVLFSLKGSADIELLKIIYEQRISYEVKRHNFSANPYQFKKSLRKLTGGFINSRLIQVSSEKKINRISFANPSIIDFLIHYLNSDYKEKQELIFSVVYLEQIITLVNLDSKGYLKLSNEELYNLYIHFQKNEDNYKSLSEKKNVNTSLLFIYLSYFSYYVEDEILLRLIENGGLENYWFNQFDTMIICLQKLAGKLQINEIISSKWVNLIEELYETASTERDFGSIRGLFSMYDISFNDFIRDSCNYDLIQTRLSEFLSESLTVRIIEDFHGYEYTSIVIDHIEYGEDEYEAVYSYELSIDLKKEVTFLLEKLILENYILEKDDNMDISLNINFEEMQQEMEKLFKDSIENYDSSSHLKQLKTNKTGEYFSEDSMIDKLFE